MTNRLTLSTLAAGMCVAAAAAPASAQFDERRPAVVLAHAAINPHANVHGVVLDDAGRPLAGVVVSAFGSTTVFAVSDENGRFAFRNMPYGPYLVRAHLQGYTPARARLLQVNRASLTVSAIALTRHADADSVPVLAAGVAGGEVASTAGEEASEKHDHGELAWRLRHLKRSVLKDEAISLLPAVQSRPSFLDGHFATVGRGLRSPAKLASLFAEVPWNGHLDLLTSASFDQAPELMSTQAWLGGGVAFLALEAPTTTGHWAMNGAFTRGDLSAWSVATSFRRAPAAHRYEAGISYGARWALDRDPILTRLLPDGGRTAGSAYAYDEWTITPALSVNYGARYARYDYLSDGGLLSPRASVTLTPIAGDSVRLRGTVSRRMSAPGAEEFTAPRTGIWAPPDRTFSALTPRTALVPQRLDHLEIAVERTWPGDLVVGVRGFRQAVDDQLVTLFGMAGTTSGDLGHYYVAPAGDFNAAGWGVSASRTVAERLKASIDYTRVHAEWQRLSAEAPLRAVLAVAAPAVEREAFHDITTSVASTLPMTETRVFLLYKVNTRFAAPGRSERAADARFDLQLTQALPFLRMTGADWEMLVAVRNLFREDLVDTSVYDEVFVVRPPKRIVGGVTVRF